MSESGTSDIHMDIDVSSYLLDPAVLDIEAFWDKFHASGDVVDDSQLAGALPEYCEFYVLLFSLS